MTSSVWPARNFSRRTSITRPGAVPCAFISHGGAARIIAWTLVLSGNGRFREVKNSVMRPSTSSLRTVRRQGVERIKFACSVIACGTEPPVVIIKRAGQRFPHNHFNRVSRVGDGGLARHDIAKTESCRQSHC